MIGKLTLVCALLYISTVSGRKYDKCQLAHELLDKYKFPKDQISTWICIVDHESKFDTNAFNSNTKDHGLFQISELYWCEPPGHPNGCHVQCSALQDDNIDDDVKCVKQVFEETQRLKKNGFEAWTTYPKYCKGDTGSYIQGCNI
ncbi:unnamed protein product [Phyllotreta striolata]|uniref:lysozyme n=1 Tax=Phyllotreta striolata TaxID=444603 RepID=A0A9N9XSE4_PHYSR|nr:unnamed protein product [Phyllotreta striolata]